MEMDRCRDLRPLFPAYAADTTSRSEAMRIQLHLGDGCAACAVEIEQLMEAFHAIPLGLAPVPLPDATRAALLGEVERTAQETVQVPDLYPEHDPNRLWKALAALAAVAVIATAWWGSRQLDEIERLEGEVSRVGMTRSVDSRSADRQIAELRAVLESAASPSATVLDLRGDGVTARVFLDDEGDVATISSRALGATDNETMHHLWLLDGERASLLGRLPPGFSQRGGQLRFRMPDPVPDGVKALITLDDAGDMPKEPGAVALK